ncbi:hypothetical protein QQ045_007840 [Rhodiola kirilowii]
MNAAFLALIPKSNLAVEQGDYRPISYCNVAYKIVSGILFERLKEVIQYLIDPAQGAFIKGRSIVGNVCLAQQLVAGYSRKHVSERMSWKIDLRKAYDSIDWRFIKEMLTKLNFPLKFISWISMCIETTSFFIQLNTEMVDFFEGKRGLRQGDPISPLLFTIAMEYLSRLLKGLTRSQGYYHHPKCHKVDIKHIIFADDMFLFSSGRCSAILALKSTLEEFMQCSGLEINVEKSQVFAAGMDETKREWIENIPCTRMGALPVRYLWFPLTVRSITAHDCSSIGQRLTQKLDCWYNHFLSRAGRRVLIQSVLQAIVLYWARICFLPRQVLKNINSICARFLWNGSATGRKCHLFSWSKACDDKKGGGLGIKNLDLMNDALVLNQLWELNNEEQNIWTKWVRAYTGLKELTGGRMKTSQRVLGCCGALTSVNISVRNVSLL